MMKREDLSPNDPRAVVEDPQVVREEMRLKLFGKLFIHGIQLAAAAFLLVVLVPSDIASSFLRTLRAIALPLGWIATLIALSGPVLFLVHRFRSRQ